MSRPSGVMIIPTGLGCKLGGDAAYNPGVKLVSACCRDLIVNPNAVNASDINELPENCLYVEGSSIDRFLEGGISLKKVSTYNRILLAVNPPVGPASVNSMRAGIWGLGADVRLVELERPLAMRAEIAADGRASGTFEGVQELISQVREISDWDALAVQTPVECDSDVADRYWTHGGVNPWGAVEAMVSRLISEAIDKPVAHAPMDSDFTDLHRRLIVARSMAPEIISNTYTYCVLKGLHRAPRIHQGWLRGRGVLSREDADFLLSPHGCWGRPHAAATAAGIPVIVVSENTTCHSAGYEYPANSRPIFVRNYLEAAGMLVSISAGVDPTTVT